MRFCGDVEQPELRLFLIFVFDPGIVFIFFLVFFCFSLGVGGNESDLLAILRPLEAADVARRDSGAVTVTGGNSPLDAPVAFC